MGPDLWEMYEDGKADDEVAAIIRLGHYGVLPKGVRVVTQFSEIITVRMTRSDVPNVSGAPEVANMVAGDTYLGPDVETDSGESQDLSVLPTDERRPKEETATGKGVVVGVVDWGFDFVHPDFRNSDGTTRILALWDQRGSRRPGSPQPFGYGIVHDREAINRALKTQDPYATLGYHPADADPGFGCHGTHVCSIAAGSGGEDRPSGIAPEADIVLVHNAPWDEAEPSRLGDSVTLLEGIDFIARTAGDRPWVINLSMGRHSGFHNGQELVEQGFDAAMRSAPGRAISLSAGNYFNKHIHASGQLRPTQERKLTWEIKEDNPTNNLLEFWYSSQDKMELGVRSPDGSLEARVRIGERAKLTAGGKEVGNVYHRSQDPISLNNHISVFLYPEAPSGPWEIILVGTDIIDGRYHAWIERDVSCPRCQSRFRPEDSDPRFTTGTICNGRRTFAVGAYDNHDPERRLGSFSSGGPTADLRLKPDLCAPGVGVLAARSATRDKNSPPPPVTRMSGTSMASPHVTGTIALMFQVAPRRLRIEETHNLLLESAERVSVPGELPDRIGIGFLDVSEAVGAARKVGSANTPFKQTTVQAIPSVKTVAPREKLEIHDREQLEIGTAHEAAEQTEVVSPGCGCSHSDNYVEANEAGSQEDETEEGLRKKLAFLSLLPHFSTVSGKDVPLTPAGMDPGIYDGPGHFKLASNLQECLKAAVDNSRFRHIHVALVDLTKDVSKPEFAGFNHKQQVFAASVPKIAAMLAAFQLRHDLRTALKVKGTKTLDALFPSVRDDWAATQNIPKSPPTSFADGITLQGKVVLWKGDKIPLADHLPKSPQLESIFPPKSPAAVEFSTTGETYDQLEKLIGDFKSASGAVDSLKHKADSKDDSIKAEALKALGKARERLRKATHDLEALGFLERLRVAMGGRVPASNLAISTIVRDVGYPYIASTLLQAGLYDPNRDGGLWLGADYWGSAWHGALAGGVEQSTTAGSAAAFMTLLAQGRLGDPASSAEMSALIQKEPNPTHPGIVSWFKEGLTQLPDEGSIVRVLSKLGAHSGLDDCAYIERKVDGGKKLIRYVAVGLRAHGDKPKELKDLILELDKCILTNNGLTLTQGGHSTEQEIEVNLTTEVTGGELSEARSIRQESEQHEGLGAGLVELADEIVLEKPVVRTSISIVHEMFERKGASEALAIPGDNHLLSAAEIFDALSSSRPSQLRRQLEQHFEVVGLPNSVLRGELREADLMLRRGDGNAAHVAVIAKPELKNVETLLAEGLTPESIGTGKYAQVVEGGVRSHVRSDQFARQLTDSAGRLLNDILLLRLATPPTVVQVQQPSKSDEPDAESENAELCPRDVSAFGRSWRTSHDDRRNPRPQKQNGSLLCSGQSDLQLRGVDKSTVDLLLWNFDIDGSYPKAQHETALNNLIQLIHDRIMKSPPAGPAAVAYEISLQGYADMTGSARYNELLANDREAAVEAYLRTNIDHFTKVPEALIGPQVRYVKMKGGFAPDALPGRNTPHARAVVVWAVPVGGVTPPPRPLPAPSTALSELTDLVRPISMGLTADKGKVLAPLATPGAAFSAALSFPGGWTANVQIDTARAMASAVTFPVSMVHSGKTHVHPAMVLQSIEWKKLSISDPSFTRGLEVVLPLTNRFILATADSSGSTKRIATGTSNTFPIETDIQTYGTIVLGYLVDGLTGNVDPLDITQTPSGQLREFLNNHAQPAGASSSKAAVLATFDFSLTSPKDDFQPKGPSPMGPAEVVRTYPLLSVWSSRALYSVAGSLEMLRPSRSAMEEMAAGGLITNAFYTDVNGNVQSLWDCLSPVWKAALMFAPSLPGVPVGAAPAVIAALHTVPCPRWDSIFAHYKLDANVSNVTVVSPSLPRRTNATARQIWDLSKSAYSASAAPVVKVERQGMFDNVHVAPAMDYKGVPAFMAPLCHHDCLHIHWRWGEQYNDVPLRGWSGGQPYQKRGSPMIPENQTLKISARGPGVTYMPTAQDVPAQSWQIFMHHGTGYVPSLTPLGVTSPLLELAQLAPNLPDFAPFYYHNRMHEIGASRSGDKPRLNESAFGPLESM